MPTRCKRRRGREGGGERESVCSLVDGGVTSNRRGAGGHVRMVADGASGARTTRWWRAGGAMPEAVERDEVGVCGRRLGGMQRRRRGGRRRVAVAVAQNQNHHPCSQRNDVTRDVCSHAQSISLNGTSSPTRTSANARAPPSSSPSPSVSLSGSLFSQPPTLDTHHIQPHAPIIIHTYQRHPTHLQRLVGNTWSHRFPRKGCTPTDT